MVISYQPKISPNTTNVHFNSEELPYHFQSLSDFNETDTRLPVKCSLRFNFPFKTKKESAKLVHTLWNYTRTCTKYMYIQVELRPHF